MAVTTYTKSGTKATTAVKLDKAIFSVVPENHELLKQAYVAYLANGRGSDAVVKTRGKVSGGGKKPWKQKGTGRARFGSSRNPIWRGGGIVFGPTGEENYSHKLNLKSKRQALRQAVSVATDAGKLKVVESFSNLDGKTKDVVTFLQKIEANGRVLCVLGERSVENEKATKNIPNLMVVSARYLNVYDILNADVLVLDQKAVTAIHEWLGGAQ
jgi:large subunit ribosomal protein L4